MRTDKKKKSSLRASTKPGVGGLKQSAVGYGKQTALLEEAITQMNAGRYGRSSEVLKELLAMDPHNMEARRLFATLHLRVGSLIPARQAFDSLIDEAFGRQDYWLAESLLREYLATGPRCVPYLEKLGSIHQDKGEELEAVVEYGKAIDILIEDPDPDHPDRAAQLYVKIRELAPASPEAVRLAGCFDAHTGQVITRSPDAATPQDFSIDENGAAPMVSEPIAEFMPWEQDGNSPSNQESASPSYLQGVPPDVNTGLQREDEGLGDAPPYESSMNGHGAFDPGSESTPSWSGDPAPLAMEQFQIPSEPSQEIQQETVGQAVPDPMPWEDVRDATIGIPDQTVTESPDALSSGLDPESVSSQSEDFASPATEQFQVLDRLPPDAQPETVPPSVSAPMPWEDVRDAAIGISDQTVTESSDAISSLPAPAQSPGDPASAVQNGGEFSWDSVFQNVLKVGNAPPVPTVQPLYAEEVDPGTIEIPEAARASLSLDTPGSSPAAAPMPWDQVQESPITIPQEQTGETAAEYLVETAPVYDPEPVYTQDRSLSILSTADDAPGTDAFSIMGSSSAPSLSEQAEQSEPDVAPADSPPAFTAVDYRDNGDAVEQEASTFSFAGEPLNPMEPAASEPSWVSTGRPLPADEPAPVEPHYESVPFSSGGDAVDSVPAPPADVSESFEEPKQAPNSPASWALLDDMPDRRAEQEEQLKPTFVEAKAPPEPASSPKEWGKARESLRFVEEPSISPVVEPTSQAPRWEEQGMTYSEPAAAAVGDVLFGASEPLAQTGTRGRAEKPTKPRQKSRSKLSRLHIGLSSFIGSCFSTSRAIVLSVIALVVLSCALAALGIGAVGLVWIIMEESPSAAFTSLTANPPRTVSDVNKNGYLFLLGFDAPPGQHPIQVGYERKADGNDADRAPACLGGYSDGSPAGQSNAFANVLNGWFKGPDPVGRFTSNRSAVEAWARQGEATLRRYGEWHKLSFDDWGYGAAVSPPCAAITFTHRLYVAEGFAQGADIGIDRLEVDMEAWRIVLGQAKTLPVKTLALQAINDDIAVASGLLVQPGFDGQYVGRLGKMFRSLNQTELSIRWPMQSELVAAARTFDSQLKAKRREKQAVHVAIASALPLPKQRRLNDYADYYEASDRAAGEGRHGALPKWSAYIQFPANRLMDYFTNPIENIVGLEPLAPWDLYNGLVVDTEAHLRLASLQAWIRRGSQDADLLSRIAKAGQKFYDPYTGLPMLVNLKKRALYSVGHDGKDQDADPQSDVVVAIPAN